jgi:hypothetical protein
MGRVATDGVSGYIFDSESAANLQKVLEMSTSIFVCLSTELAGLYHVDEPRLELEAVVSNCNLRSSANIGHNWN